MESPSAAVRTEPPDAPPAGERPARSDRAQLLRAGGLGALFVVVTLVMALPSVELWTTHVPGNHGDAFLQQWLLQWDVHALLDRSQSIFHPNIFWPTKNTLFYSDTQLAAAPFVGLVALVTGWHGAYNVVYVTAWVASLASAYGLARWVGVSRAGAVLTGFVFTFAAVRLGHSGHFQLLFVFFVPLALLLVLRFLTERKWWQAGALGVVMAATFLNVAYIALALVPAIGVVVSGWLIATRFRPGPRFYAGLLGAAALAVLVTRPVLAGYRAQAEVLKPAYAPSLATSPSDFLAPATGSLLYGWLEDAIGAEYENRLFPGFVAIVLGGVGTVAVWRRRASRRPDDPPPEPDERLRRRGLVLVLLSTVPALVLAFGKYQTIGDWRLTLPYSWVAEWPGLRSIRAFGRFTAVPLLGLGLLAGFGFDRLSRSWTPTVRRVVAVAVGAFMLLEYKATVTMAERVDIPEFASVNRELDGLPAGPVLELPMGDHRRVEWAYVEAPRMVLSTIDWNPRVNGYTGYAPPEYAEKVDTFNALASGEVSPAALALLDRLGVRYIVLRLAPLDRNHAHLNVAYYDAETADRVLAAIPPERVEATTRHGEAILVRLSPP